MRTRNIYAIVCFTIWGWVCLASVPAQAERPFDQVADEIQQQHQEALEEEARIRENIARQRAELTGRLEALKQKLAETTDQVVVAELVLNELAGERDALQQEIAGRSAGKAELTAIFTEHTRNFLARAEKTPFSAEQPQHLATLRTFADTEPIWGMADINTLLELYFANIAAGAQNTRTQTAFLNRSGETQSGDIIRLGHLAALYRTDDETAYLMMSLASGRLLASAAPPWWVRRNLNRFYEEQTREVWLDISGGIALQQLARKVTPLDQLRSGGVLVIPILLVGLVALVLTLERLFFFSRVRQNTDHLMTRVTEQVAQGDFKGALQTTAPHRQRPTGRVLMAGLVHRGQSREVIESALSEAILRETPRLERFSGALKVLAAVAPLLGLLGTVTGMINTFQVITTHGTGDPRLMAGGISEAMVTTQVGLAVAIPIMIIAACLSRRASGLAQDMEEKGLALMGAMLKLNHDANSVFKPT